MICVNMVHTVNKFMKGCKYKYKDHILHRASIIHPTDTRTCPDLSPIIKDQSRNRPLKEETYTANTMYFSAQLSSVPGMK